MTPRPLRRAVLLPGLFFLLLAAYNAYAPTSDPDIWWHLRIGEVALRQHTTLPTEIFSYRFAGQGWPYKDLLADVLLYAGFAAIGFSWFFLLKLAAGACMALGLLLCARRQPLVVLC